jgi:serine protease Do
VLLGEGERAPSVQEVMKGSGADKAGLLVDDVITHVNGQQVTSRNEMIEKVRRYRPGDRIQLQVARGDESLAVTAVLSTLSGIHASRENEQIGIHGPLSDRTAGFPSIFEHDSVLKPTDCGSALVNLDGKVVGVNIARASRVATYAIPASKILPLLDDLKSGQATHE